MALTKIKAAALTADLIDETKLADNSIDSEHYNDGSIDEAHIADDAVTADKLANAINTDIAAKAVLTGSTNNTIPTVTGANAISGEANLTFDGSKLVIAGTGSTDGNNTVDGAGFNSGTLYHRTRGASAGIAGTDYSNQIISKNGSNVALEIFTAESNTGTPVVFGTNGVQRARVETNGNFTISDGDLVIGTAGHGIDFSAQTASTSSSSLASELLDHYETGTWTPTIRGYNTAGTGTYSGGSSHQQGTYTRIGNVVTVWYYINWQDLTGSSGSMCIAGLPFSAVSGSGWQQTGSVMTNQLAMSDDCTGIVTHQWPGSGALMMFYQSRTGSQTWDSVALDTYGAAIGCTTYPCA